ncbi:MAG: bifunctional metallophosphatase/5'-nucleotidase [bacterium]|nr:bifunctional metallophosphatase/5'-nucleotidase [bacterium]
MDIQRVNSAVINTNNTISNSAAPVQKAAEQGTETAMPSDGVSIGEGKEGGDVRSLRILHINDLHGAVDPEGETGGLAKVATVFKEERAEAPDATLTLNTGDIAEGSMIAYLTKGQVVADSLANIGFDAIEPGNHDFAWGQQALQDMLTDVNAPVLGANIVHDDGTDFGTPYMFKEVNGVKVGIIGVDVQNMARYISADKLEGLEFKGVSDTIAKYLPEVKAGKPDIIMLMSHIGFEEDKKIAQQFPEIDVIVGGHSHDVLPEGHYEGNTLIVQSGTKGRYVGEVDLSFDMGTRSIVGAEARLIPVDGSVEPDPEVAAIISAAQEKVDEIGARVMGQAEEELPYSHTETSILNQIHADSVHAASGAEITLVSARNLRGSVEPGEVTYQQLFSAFPHTEEDAVVMKCTGRQLMEEMEERIADGGRGPATPAGFTYTYDSSLPSGSRITDITLADGSKLDPDREYTVGTTISMARKSRFKGCDVKTIGSSQEMFMEAFQNGSPWHNNPDARSMDVNPNK